MSFTKVAPAGIGTEPGDGYRICNSFLHSTGLNVSGIITATQGGTVTYFGDGSNLEGVSSSGVGTALSDDDTSPLNKVYYTNSILEINTDTIIDSPSTAASAYTNYAEIKITDGNTLTIRSGDELKLNVLGIGTLSNY